MCRLTPEVISIRYLGHIEYLQQVHLRFLAKIPLKMSSSRLQGGRAPVSQGSTSTPWPLVNLLVLVLVMYPTNFLTAKGENLESMRTIILLDDSMGDVVGNVQDRLGLPPFLQLAQLDQAAHQRACRVIQKYQFLIMGEHCERSTGF